MPQHELIRRIQKRLYDQDKPHPPEETALRIRGLEAERGSYALNSQPREQKITVSLTSFPPRYEGLHTVIKSLLTQTVRPDRIALYYDETDAEVPFPDTLTELSAYGVEFCRRDTPDGCKPLRPHKKYLYAMQEHPDDLIITVDDDSIYPPDLIEKLTAAHKRNPRCVVAARAHLMRFENGRIAPYDSFGWCLTKEDAPSMRYIPTGVGGVLYPPECMDSRLFDTALICKLCPDADDLWLKTMQVLAGTKVTVCDRSVAKRILPVPDSQTESLNSQNVLAHRNDEYLSALCRAFSLTEADFTGDGA